jgi:hypothetical protein
MFDELETPSSGAIFPAADDGDAATTKTTASVQSITAFKRAVRAAADEFLSSFDRDEFLRCIAELDCSMHHQEIPYLLVRRCLSADAAIHTKAASLLHFLFEKEVLTTVTYTGGMRKLYFLLDEFRLDVPTASDVLAAFTKHGEAAEMVNATTVASLKALGDAYNADSADELKESKRKIRNTLNEYFDSEDLAEVVLAMQEQNIPHLHHEVAKQAVSMALDRGAREREMTSFLLANLTGDLLSVEAVELGFEILLSRVDDLAIDIPGIIILLAQFVARAVVDECVSPAFLIRMDVADTDVSGTDASKPSDMQALTLSCVHRLLRQKQASLRLERVWGGGEWSVGALKRQVNQLVCEYLDSGDGENAIAVIRELKCPIYAHEYVKRVFVAALDGKERELELAERLLVALSASTEKLLSSTQLAMGLRRIREELSDIELDVPTARASYARIATALGVTSPKWNYDNKRWE